MNGDQRYACPTCGAAASYHAVMCSRCETDLSSVAKLFEASSALFNAAVLAARQKQWGEAIRQVSAGLHINSQDADAWRLLGKLFAAAGSIESAEICLSMAAFQSGRLRGPAGGDNGSGQTPSLGQMMRTSSEEGKG